MICGLIQGECQCGVYSWGWTGVFHAGASPHPAAVIVVEAFLQVPWRAGLGCWMKYVGVFAGCVCNCWAPGTEWPSQSLKLHIVPGCDLGKQALYFLLPSPWSSVLQSFGELGFSENMTVGSTSCFWYFQSPSLWGGERGWRLHH